MAISKFNKIQSYCPLNCKCINFVWKVLWYKDRGLTDWAIACLFVELICLIFLSYLYIRFSNAQVSPISSMLK